MKLNKFTLLLYVSLTVINNGYAQQTIPQPKPHQMKWHEAEIGVIFHYDLHVFDGVRYRQGDNRIRPVDDYNIFNPKLLDTDQWIRAAKEAGATFALLTATHETGFALYQSDVNPYCLKAVKWRDGKGDLVLDFVNSCRKYDIQPGIYIGIRWNSFLGIHNFKTEGAGDFAKNRQAWYKRMCEKMTEELCTRYGDLFMIWFDGGADDPESDGPDVLPIVSRNQPECLFYHNVQRADLRWGGSETGTVGYPCWSTFPLPYSHNKNTDSQQAHLTLLKHGDPEGKFWVPAMADVPLRGANGRHEWFWEPDDEENIYPLTDLVAMYEKSVGRNATLILGLTPNPEGLLPVEDVTRLKEFGEKIKERYGIPLKNTLRNALDNASENTSKNVPRNNKPLQINLEKETHIDACIIQENLAAGERVREYAIEAKINGIWTEICHGASIGHKRIERFPPVMTQQLRLVIHQSIAAPQITHFNAYQSNE